jgi:hypothetical protein
VEAGEGRESGWGGVGDTATSESDAGNREYGVRVLGKMHEL